MDPNWTPKSMFNSEIGQTGFTWKNRRSIWNGWFLESLNSKFLSSLTEPRFRLQPQISPDICNFTREINQNIEINLQTVVGISLENAQKYFKSASSSDSTKNLKIQLIWTSHKFWKLFPLASKKSCTSLATKSYLATTLPLTNMFIELQLQLCLPREGGWGDVEGEETKESVRSKDQSPKVTWVVTASW